MRFFCLGAFGTVMLLHETCCKTHQTGPKTHVFVHFFSVWVHFGPFRYCTKLGAKWANLLQLMQKFVPQRFVRISRNLRSQSTQLDPKLMFSCVSFRLGAFGTISLLHKTRNKTCHTGAINGKVRATMSCYNFTQRMLPIRTIGP